MDKFKIIGKSFPRFDGPVKVTGETKFLADIDMPGSWVGGIIRSDVPRGILKNINTPPEFDADGAVLVTAADIPGEDFIAMVRQD